MPLTAASLDWAINFVQSQSDGDLFPKVLEIDAIAAERADFIGQFVGKNLSDFEPGSCRRFIVPKDDISYRQATQLDPQDSILLSAIIHQYGNGIEARRLPLDTVFSYRFKPTATEGLYSNRTAWNDFWGTAARKVPKTGIVLYCDIADFYNQVYHHTVENQLFEAGLPNQEVKWIKALLESTTANVSRGVPVGPHAVHLIAEATLVPIDNHLKSEGVRFLRYADDIVVFCRSEGEARSALATIATVLDKQQRLTLQRHKTKLFAPGDFLQYCATMIEDRPISGAEDAVLKLINKYSGGNPYRSISYSQIKPDDWAKISPAIIRGIVEDYASQKPIDFIRLRWFFRRLSQIGHPGAIEVALDRLDVLGPCLANICAYLASVQSISNAEWRKLGGRLLKLMQSREVKEQEYFRLSILSLFSRNKEINHFARLAKLFQQADPFLRREIILAAATNGAHDWLRQLKEQYPSMDPWQQSAYVYAIAGLPREERRFFIGRKGASRPFARTLEKWAKNA